MKNISIAMFLALFASVAVAQSQYSALNDNENLLTYLEDLDEKQKDEIKLLSMPHERKRIDYTNQLAELRARLHRLESAVKVDMEEVNKTINDISVLQAKVMKNKAEYRQKVRNVLSDEQRIAYDKKATSSSEVKTKRKSRKNKYHSFASRKRGGS